MASPGVTTSSGLIRRVLHVFPPCGRAGTEAVLRFLIAGLKQHGIESEAFFQRDLGGGDLFRALCPTHFEHERPMAQVIAEGRFDLIHSVSSSITIGLPEAMARAGYRGPVAASCHGDYIIGWNRATANVVIALTGHWARRIEPFTDLPVRVIGNPVDTQRFQVSPRRTPPSGSRLLGWVGRLNDPHKNVPLLRAVMEQLPEGDATFQTADTNKDYDPALALGDAARRIESWGHVDYAGMPQFYQRLTERGGALLFTSEREAFPMAVLEAMASGCPVVVPDAWGSDEIVEHGRSGLIFRRSEGVAGVLRCLEQLRDPETWLRISNGARERVEREYAMDVVLRQYLDAFVETAARPRTRSAAYELAWAARSASFYTQKLPQAVWHFRPRRAVESMDRALRANEAGTQPKVRAELLDALRMFPPIYLKPWRAKFLLRTLLTPQHR